MMGLINEKQEIQQEIMLRLEYLTMELINSIGSRSAKYEHVLELDIINTISANIQSVFDLSTDNVPSEILIPWYMVKVHKELLALRVNQDKISNELYLELLDKIANNLFTGLFINH